MVIQRWQSLLLLVAVVMMCCFTFFSLGQVQTPDYSFNFTSLGFTYEGESTGHAPEGMFLSTWYFFILSLTTALLMLIDIFMYGNLVLQKKVCLVTILMAIAAAATCGCLGYTAVEGGTIGWSTNILSVIIAVVAAILAYGCMRRDHNRLKSVDRLR